MKITIASGKGGTGKTTVAVNMAWALAHAPDAPIRVRLLDCDVEEPNDHLFVRPRFTARKKVEVLRPVWDPEKCTGCGKCAAACRYNALAVVKGKVLLFPELCHACGVCTYVCPEGALHEEPAAIGEVRIGESGHGFEFVDGVLNPAEALAPTVVRAVKKHAADADCVLLDAAPGTACPVVEAMSDVNVVLLVTEPTPFGLHDLKLAAALALRIGVPTGILVNRSDGDDALIREYAEQTGIPIVGRIPFRREFAEAYSRGEMLAERFPEVAETLIDVFAAARRLADSEPVSADVAEAAIGFAADSAETAESAHQSAGGGTPSHEITIISGKGGTGKTTVTGALTRLLPDKVLADCDVDAADLHLLVNPRVRERHAFTGGAEARIIAERCTSCGRCAAACHFDAIHRGTTPGPSGLPAFEVDPFACEGCGLCQQVCPVDAVVMETGVQGKWYVSDTAFGRMVHARLGIGQENSGKLVGLVRDRAAQEAAVANAPLICADGPPGTGCPVISSISGTDLAVIVTEPTVSGVHDMERVLQLTAHFRVPVLIVINKYDLNSEQVARIEEIAAAWRAPVIARIPFDPNVVQALMQGRSVVDFAPDSPAAVAIKSVKKAVEDALLHPSK